MASAALLAGARSSIAATKKLNVLCHRVHQLCLTTGAAGDLTEPWREANDAEIAWSTFDTDALQDRLFREASLDETDFWLGLSRQQPCDAELGDAAAAAQRLQVSKSAIEDFDDIAPGLVQAHDRSTAS